ncbi:hypothetical protein [Paludibaculum fermentans]|uniref:hypothetical protein n=1 Tax=Paludibaculum fermentans TaxID=1473598 RepID=UPI003EBC7B47
MCLFAALLAPAGALTIEVVEGSGAIAARGSVSPQRFTVQVKDAAGAPAPSVTVQFRLPSEGPSGDFPSGSKSESVLTGPDGKAYVRGIRWNSTPGKLDLLVLVTNQDQRVETTIAAEISAELPASRQLAPKTAKKWIILAVVSGATAAGLAVVRGGATAPSVTTAPAAASLPPSLGAPVITIGKP